MDKSRKSKWFFLWSQRLVCISLLGFYTAISLETGSSYGAAIAKLNNWKFYPKSSQLEFTLSAGTTPHYFYLSQPPRLVIDLPDTKLGYILTKQDYRGAIQSIRVSQLNTTMTRIVLDLAPGTFIDIKQVKLQPVSKSNPTRWVLRPFISKNTRSIQPTKLQPVVNSLSPKPTATNLSLPPKPTATNLSPSQNYIQLPSTLPAITTNQQPYITVPPLTPNNLPQIQGAILPPPNFPNQSSNLNNIPLNEPKIPVIEFGQPLPKSQ